MALIYAGIDEAGYGPMLGPLVVAMSAVHVAAWSPPDPAPDLWRALHRTVAPALTGAAGRIPIADSKKLKVAGSRRTHPLTHLERGVLAALAASGPLPATDAALFDRLGIVLPAQPWYQGPPLPLPLANHADSLAIDAAQLRAAMHAAGLAPFSLRCALLDEARFNDGLARHGSKAAVSAQLVASLMAQPLRDTASTSTHLRIAVDRQSGRADYTDLIRAAAPEATITDAVITPGLSRYQLASPDHAGDIAVRFQTEAERHHLPVALASMAAKLVREIAMLRFNRYWSLRMPELKPTAGYVTDARRWLRDAKPILTRDDQAALIRRA